MAGFPTLSDSRKGRWLWWGGFAAILAVHVVWEILHTAPPPWDMAHHQLRGLEALGAWRQGELLSRFPSLSDYYPPLYYLQEAFVFGLFGNTRFIALLTNLPPLFLLGYFTRKAAARLLDPIGAAAAGLLPLLFPMTAWTSRESLLDVPLAGWATVSVFALMQSRGLQSKGWSLIFGVCAAAGMLTKWTFFLFLAPPILFALAMGQDGRRAVKNLLDASLAALPAVFWWYLPNARSLLQRFESTSASAVAEQDPAVMSLLGWAYYPRSLSSYYLYLPLTALLVWGLFRRWKKRTDGGIEDRAEIRFLAVWLLGGLLLMTLLRAKDPRYIMPLAAPLAILLVYVWRYSRPVVAGILSLAALQFLSVSFAWPGTPIKLALFEYDPPSHYRTLSREWVLYQSAYFDVAGPPRREDWKLDEVAAALPNGVRVGFVPELPRFHTAALQLAATQQGHHLDVFRLGAGEVSDSFLDSLAYVVGKTGFQGIDYLTEYNQALYEKLKRQGWEVVREWDLPDSSRAMLWRRREVGEFHAKPQRREGRKVEGGVG